MESETIKWILSIGGGLAVMSLSYFGLVFIEKRRIRALVVCRLQSAIHAAATKK